MAIATLGNTQLAFLDEGSGDPIVLIHGFASTREFNWVMPGWVKMLVNTGYRVIAADNRGHGESSKYYSEADYSLEIMTEDIVALMDHLGVPRAHIMGYSMGARITCTMAIKHGARCQKLILGGNGYAMVEGSGDWSPVHDALLTGNPEGISDARGAGFRTFADRTGSDRKALAACLTGVRQLISADAIAAIENQTLIAVGTRDDVAGSGEKLAQTMSNAQWLPIPNRDHMRAVGDKVFFSGVHEFLRTNRAL